MNENDKQLLDKAKKLSPVHWGTAAHYAEMAESIEAKNELESLAKSLYHKEEGHDI